MKNSFRKRVKSSDFQTCSEIIAPLVSVGDFDAAFEKMREFRIGPNTMNSGDQNFLCTFIEALYSHDRYGPIKNGVGANRDARDNYLSMVRLIIDQGVDLNHRDKSGSTVLSYAAEGAVLDFCKLILEYESVEVDLFDPDGQTALDLVITDFYNLENSSPRFEKKLLGWKTELVRILLLNGADPYRPYFNESTAPPTKYSRYDPYDWLKDDDGRFFYKNPAHYVIEQSLEYAELFHPEYKGREEEEPLRKVFFDTLKEMGKVNEEK